MNMLLDLQKATCPMYFTDPHGDIITIQTHTCKVPKNAFIWLTHLRKMLSVRILDLVAVGKCLLP